MTAPQPRTATAPSPVADGTRPLVEVRDLRVSLVPGGADVVGGVSFELRPGELLGLLGESGSGKTTIALALLGHTRRGLGFSGGQVVVDGLDLLQASKRELRRLRGAEVAYVPQDPASALNPALRVGTQLAEVLSAHGEEVEARGLGRSAVAVDRVVAEAGLAGVPGLLRSYPHQLSGGQQQRVALAMAFALRPKVIVFDEPTTGLDVTTQRHVLGTIRDLCRTHGVAGVYVSHDLAVVVELVDRLMVLYAGQLAEVGPAGEVFGSPAHPYTARLLRAVPSHRRAGVPEGIAGQPPRPGQRPPGCAFAPRCPLAVAECSDAPVPVVTVAEGHSVRCLRHGHTEEITGARPAAAPAASRASGETPLVRVSDLCASYGATEVLRNVSLAVGQRDCVAVVGESGSGKTTLARCMVGLHRRWSGSVRLVDTELARGATGRSRDELRAVQYVFQNPYTSLNPRKTIGRIIGEPLSHFSPSSDVGQRRELVDRVLGDVALGADFRSRYPGELSGGERQRVAIARALVVEPRLLVCDEITSALDVSVQATIVALLRRLQAERDLSLLFITHNLALVRSIAGSVVVMAGGRVVEEGPVDDVFERPAHEYTARLIEDAPKLVVTGDRRPPPPSRPSQAPSGGSPSP